MPKDAFGSRNSRAKQFAPFASLRGYYSVVRERERSVEPRREITEELQREVSETLSVLHKGDMVSVTYYDKDAYVTRKGVVTAIDPIFRTLDVVRDRIAFDDLYELSIEE